MADGEQVRGRTGIRALGEVIDRSMTAGTRGRLVLIVVGTVLASLLDVLGVLAMVPLMVALTGSDAVAGSTPLDVILPEPGTSAYLAAAAAVLVGAFAAKSIFTATFRWWSLGVLAVEQVRVSSWLMERHLLAPYSMHRQRGYAELTNVLGAVVPTAFRALSTVLIVISEAFTVGMVAVAVVAIEPVLAVIAILLLGGLGGVFQFTVRKRQRELGMATIRLSQAAGAAQLQAYGGAQEVKLRDNATPFVDTYEDANLKAVRASRSQTFIGELPKYLFEVLFIVVLASAAVFLEARSGGDGAALVPLATFGVAGMRMLPSAVRMLASIGIVRSSWPGVESLLDELDRLDELDERVPPPGQVEFDGGLRLRDVRFEYESGKPALDGVTLDVPRGSSIALVGPSGSGKSTLVDVILGLQRPTRGTIESSGHELWESIVDWRTSVGVVPQSIFLLDDTLTRNIVFDVPDEDIDVDLLHRVVRQAQLDEVVASTPDGLDLVLGEHGTRLSGGQRQRVGIARALYRRPKLLVLDEATSALDNITEQRISSTVDSLRGDVTVVMVAHRLSTVRGADQFLVLDNGRVEALGSFEHAVATSPTFAQMVKLGSLDVATERSSEPSE